MTVGETAACLAPCWDEKLIFCELLDSIQLGEIKRE